ncbi:hypothetical protein Tco_0328198 [Tanacetum coccineum]
MLQAGSWAPNQWTCGNTASKTYVSEVIRCVGLAMLGGVAVWVEFDSMDSRGTRQDFKGQVYKKLGGRWGKQRCLGWKDAIGSRLDESLETEEALDVVVVDSDSLKNVTNDSVDASRRVLREGMIAWKKNLEDDAGEILGVHSQGVCWINTEEVMDIGWQWEICSERDANHDSLNYTNKKSQPMKKNPYAGQFCCTNDIRNLLYFCLAMMNFSTLFVVVRIVMTRLIGTLEHMKIMVLLLERVKSKNLRLDLRGVIMEV